MPSISQGGVLKILIIILTPKVICLSIQKKEPPFLEMLYLLLVNELTITHFLGVIVKLISCSYCLISEVSMSLINIQKLRHKSLSKNLKVL